MRLPGTRLLRLARVWFDEGTVANIFEPLVADWQREAATAPRGRRRVCLVRGGAAFLMSFALVLPRVWLRPLPPRLVASIWSAAALFTMCGVLILFIPYLPFLSGAGSHLLLYLLPSSLTVALPLALVPAAIVARRFGRAQGFELRALVARLTLSAMFLLVLLLGWITPHANQAWREAVAPDGAVALRGTRELTVPELLSAQPPAERGLWRPRDWEGMRRTALVERTSVAAMPLTMGVLGLALARIRGRGWAAVMLASWVAAGFLWIPMFYMSGPVMSHGTLLTMASLVCWLSSEAPQTAEDQADLR